MGWGLDLEAVPPDGGAFIELVLAMEEGLSSHCGQGR